MTLTEANRILVTVDCRDPDAATAALADRARAIAEFAASASLDSLNESLAAGEAFRQKLEDAQTEARRELGRITNLTRGLETTLGECQADRITCFG